VIRLISDENEHDLQSTMLLALRMSSPLTVDVQVNRFDVRPQARHGRHTFQVCLVVICTDDQRARPSLSSVLDRSQTAQSRHGGRVFEPEVVGDVALTDVDVEARRRISAGRDAAQWSRLIFHGAQDV